MLVGHAFRFYDNEDIVLEYDGLNVLLASYTHGLGIDEPLIMNRGGVDSFYHADGLGSITDLTDNLGAVVQSYVYDSFGNIVAQNGSLENPYTYTGREFDEESGLYYYRTRYYDSSIGRFISEDPIGFLSGNINLYTYVSNNPVTFIDPSGLIELKDIPKEILRTLCDFFALSACTVSDAAATFPKETIEGLKAVQRGGVHKYVDCLLNQGDVKACENPNEDEEDPEDEEPEEPTKDPNPTPPSPTPTPELPSDDVCTEP